jgi:hypothetical protein
MISRRRLVGSGVVGGLLGALGGREAEAVAAAAQQRGDRDNFDEVVQALNNVRSELRSQREFTEIAQIREAQRTFLRANGKLPDFIEVGANAWFDAYDWHVRWQQPLSVGRDVNGRLTLALLQTLVILRPEVAANFISLPYDAR